jgi:uncharacterized Zn finger protein
VFPFAHVLHRDGVRHLAGTAVFARGESYFREGRVGSYRVDAGALSADVRGTELYRGRIWVKGDGLAYSCPCPFSREEGVFCKHLVALALAFLHGEGKNESVAPDRIAHLGAALEALPGAELVALVVDAARRERAVLLTLEAELKKRSPQPQ